MKLSSHVYVIYRNSLMQIKKVMDGVELKKDFLNQ